MMRKTPYPPKIEIGNVVWALMDKEDGVYTDGIVFRQHGTLLKSIKEAKNTNPEHPKCCDDDNENCACYEEV